MWHEVYLASGATCREEIGHGNSPAQNPPPLEGGDAFAWAWFHENVGPFAQQFGLVPLAIQELGLGGVQKSLFLRKLDLILETLSREEMTKAENDRRKQ